jgi:hypothetical protein
MHMWAGAWRCHWLCSSKAPDILLSLRKQPPRKSPEAAAYTFTRVRYLQLAVCCERIFAAVRQAVVLAGASPAAASGWAVLRAD